MNWGNWKFAASRLPPALSSADSMIFLLAQEIGKSPRLRGEAGCRKRQTFETAALVLCFAEENRRHHQPDRRFCWSLKEECHLLVLAIVVNGVPRRKRWRMVFEIRPSAACAAGVNADFS